MLVQQRHGDVSVLILLGKGNFCPGGIGIRDPQGPANRSRGRGYDIEQGVYVLVRDQSCAFIFVCHSYTVTVASATAPAAAIPDRTTVASPVMITLPMPPDPAVPVAAGAAFTTISDNPSSPTPGTPTT